MRRRSQAKTNETPAIKADATTPNLSEALIDIVGGCRHKRIVPYGDGSMGRCDECGESTFPLRSDEGLDLDVGDAITITMGAEHFAPIKYHGFDVGPFSVTVRVRSGELPHDAYARAKSVLCAIMANEFEAQLNAHFERIRQSAKGALIAGIAVK